MPDIILAPAAQDDLEHLVALRIDAMRASLERIGRFGAVRARERFAATFVPALTRHIMLRGVRVGFVVVKQEMDELVLDYIYLTCPPGARLGRGGTVVHLRGGRPGWPGRARRRVEAKRFKPFLSQARFP